MISKDELELFFKYNNFGYNGRYIPKKFQEFSNSVEFEYLDTLFQRLLLEKHTKVAESYKKVTKIFMEQKLDSYLIGMLLNYVENYPEKEKDSWWKLW